MTDIFAVERRLSELDHVRLSRLVHRHKGGRRTSPTTGPIEQLLGAAEVLSWPELPPDVVTMRSRVLLQDLQTGLTSRWTLSFPGDAESGANRVSVLSPLGFSLLGQRAGATVRWSTPAGDTLAAVVLDILFQPESSGDYAM